MHQLWVRIWIVWFLLLSGIACISQSEAFWHGTAAASTVPQDPSGWYNWASGVGSNGYCDTGIGCAGSDLNTTQIIYVAAGGSGSGTFASPAGNIFTATSHMRAGAPDWLLVRKGDTFTDDVIGHYPRIGGKDCAHPMVFSSYDGGTNNHIPNPYTGGARPLLKVDTGAPDQAFLFSDHDFVAVSGLNFYAWERDPSSSFFLKAQSQSTPGGAGISNVSCFYLEDTSISYFGTGFGTTAPNPHSGNSNLFIHRSQIIGNYPPSPGRSQGLDVDNILNGPAGVIIDGSAIDYNGFNTSTYTADGGGTITWAPADGGNHNLYMPGLANNGDQDSGTAGNQPTITNNLISNEAGASQFRSGGLVTNNIFLREGQPFAFQQPFGLSNTIIGNVLHQPIDYGIGVTGIEVSKGYINENITTGSVQIKNNILSASLQNPSSDAIDINSGVNGTVATGNIIYNWAFTGGNTLNFTTGGIYSGTSGLLTITNPGSSYTDISSPISATAAWSGGGCGDSAGANDIAITVGSAVSGSLTSVWITGIASIPTGLYQACGQDSTHLVIFQTNCTGTCPGSASGTVYYPYYMAVPTNIAPQSGSGSGALIDIIVAGGQVVAASLMGSDNIGDSDKGNARGTGYVAGDTVRIDQGAACVGANCGSGFSPGAGSGMVLTIPTIASVSGIGANGCTLATQNDTSDNTGTNVCGYTDPLRSAGSYYATLAGSTASATFTGVLATVSGAATSVLTVSSITGSLNLGDAITWAGQIKADYIKFNSANTGTNSCGTLTACTGSGGAGLYAVAGTETHTSSMSSWTAQQLIAAMDANNKSSGVAVTGWNTALTANCVNQYINAGFGITSACP